MNSQFTKFVLAFVFWPISLVLLLIWLLSRDRGKLSGASQSSSSPDALTGPQLWQKQQRYFRRMTSSPKLKGDGTFAIPVVGGYAYQENLDTIRQMLELEYTVDSTFMAVLELEPNNPVDPNAIRIAVADETVGYLAARLAKRIKSKLSDLGGLAIAEARFQAGSEAQGMNLELDLVIPLQKAS